MDRQLRQTALSLQLRDLLLRSRETCGRITDGPSRNVPRTVDIGVSRMSTRGADKDSLTLTVSPFTMRTLGTRLRRIPCIDNDERHTAEFSLIGEESLQLCERPTAHPGTLRFRKPYPLPDIPQILNGYPALRVLGKDAKVLGYAVIFVGFETGFFPTKPLQSPEHGTGTLIPLALSASRTLKPTPTVGASDADNLDFGTAEHLAVGSGCDVHNSEVNAQELADFNRSAVGYVDCGVQVELTVAEHEVDLPLDPVKVLSLVLTVHDGNEDTSRTGQDACCAPSLEAEAAFVVGDRTIGPEAGNMGLVSSEHFDRLPDCAHGQLCGQSVALAKLRVAEPVDRGLAEHPGLERNPGGASRRSVARGHYVAERHSVLSARQQSRLEGQFHSLNIFATISFRRQDCCRAVALQPMRVPAKLGSFSPRSL
jgi:hypothetical protein